MSEKMETALRAIVFHNDKYGSSLPVTLIEMVREAIPQRVEALLKDPEIKAAVHRRPAHTPS